MTGQTIKVAVELRSGVKTVSITASNLNEALRLARMRYRDALRVDVAPHGPQRYAA